jgi:hypothetical protein
MGVLDAILLLKAHLEFNRKGIDPNDSQHEKIEL